MLRQKYSYRKDIETRKKPNNKKKKRKNRTKVCNLTKTSKSKVSCRKC